MRSQIVLFMVLSCCLHGIAQTDCADLAFADTIDLVVPKLEAIAFDHPESVEIHNGEIVFLDTLIKFTNSNSPPLIQWSIHENGSIVMIENTFEIDSGTPTLYFTFFDLFGCLYSDSITVDLLVSIEQVNMAKDILIHPNPNNGRFTVLLQGAQDEHMIHLYDIYGQVWWDNILQCANSECRFEVDADYLASGVYFIGVGDPGKEIIHKVLIK